MQPTPLTLTAGHLFATLDGAPWLLDTGAPMSFGSAASVSIAGTTVAIAESYMGLDAATLTEMVGAPCAGLLGADVLGRFDHIIDVPGGRLISASDELEHSGDSVALDDFMGIPICDVAIDGRSRRFFFDTGAQISYFHDDAIAAHPEAGSLTDFYPGFGQFETDTHDVPIAIAGLERNERCGRLPGLLGMTLMLGGVHGILGNALLRDRAVGYFPRRRVLVV